MPESAFKGAGNIQWQGLQVCKALRAARLNQTPRCIWLTGLSGSGKTTLANLLEERLFAEGRHPLKGVHETGLILSEAIKEADKSHG